MKLDRGILDAIKITDNILFTSVFENTNIVKKFIEMVLGFDVVTIKLNQKEKVMDSIGISRGVRLDIYVEDSNNKIYDIEIQTSDEKDLLKRMRYYQARLDLDNLNKGDEFNNLKTTYIIFICTFNPFKKLNLNDAIYKIEPRLITQNNAVYAVDDDSHKVIINTKCDVSNIQNVELKSFVELLENGYQSNTDGELSKMMVEEANKLKQNENWRSGYMTLLEEVRKQAKIEGIKQGKAEGIKDIIIEMLKDGVDNNIILKYGKLTVEQLEEMKKEL